MKLAVKITGTVLLILFAGMFLMNEIRTRVPQTQASVSLLGIGLVVFVAGGSWFAVSRLVWADRARRYQELSVTDPSD